MPDWYTLLRYCARRNMYLSESVVLVRLEGDVLEEPDVDVGEGAILVLPKQILEVRELPPVPPEVNDLTEAMRRLAQDRPEVSEW